MWCDRRLNVVGTGVLLLAQVGIASATPTYQAAGPVQGPPRWVAAKAPAISAPLVTANFGFETGNFSGWTVVNEVGGSGDWFVYTGSLSPLNQFTIFPPPNGKFAAITDQGNPGSHILYQDIMVPPSGPAGLTIALYYINLAGVFFTPPTLDAFSSGSNQQYRVDIMDPAASVDSVAAGDVLLNVFQTNVGDPPTMAPRLVPVDLTPFAGQTVRLRLAEVDNQSNFLAGVDDGIAPRSAAPALGPVGLAVVVVILLLTGSWSVTHHRKRI